MESSISDDIIEAAKDEGYSEVEVAYLFGKVPLMSRSHMFDRIKKSLNSHYS